MKEELRSRFVEAYNNLSKILGGSHIAEQLVQYEFYSLVQNCLKGNDSSENKEYFEHLLTALFSSLGDVVSFNAEYWDAYFYGTKTYKDFCEKYRLPEYLTIMDVGTFWPMYIDYLDDEPIDVKLRMLHQLEEYKNWVYPYCKVFAYQYWVEHPGNLFFDLNYLPILQYWEYSVTQEVLTNLADKSLYQRMRKLNSLYCADEFSQQFPDRETLFFDFVEKGISIPEAMQITKRIRTGGHRFTSTMQERLLNAGYSEELVATMKNYGYIKSWESTTVKMLFITNLLEGII